MCKESASMSEECAFFLEWYSFRLLRHAETILSIARLSLPNPPISTKVASDYELLSNFIPERCPFSIGTASQYVANSIITGRKTEMIKCFRCGWVRLVTPFQQLRYTFDFLSITIYWLLGLQEFIRFSSSTTLFIPLVKDPISPSVLQPTILNGLSLTLSGGFFAPIIVKTWIKS